jgi:hypothetical protein
VRVRPAPAALLLFLASSAAAQTADPAFARWRWAPPELGSRPAGMGGAFAAVADSARAVYANPAGLAQIPVTEIDLSSGRPWMAAARSLTWLRVSAYVTKSDEQETGPGGLESSVWEAGLGLGVEPRSGMRVGMSLARSRLRLEGGPLAPSESSRWRLTAGALLNVVGSEQHSLPSLQLALVFQPGFDWRAPLAGDAAPAEVDIHRPTLITAGLAWQTSNRWGFSAQGDWIRYREVVDVLRRNVGAQADGFHMADVMEPRLGTEFTAPLWCGCGAVKLRGGLHYRSAGMLRYHGGDAPTAAAFNQGTWRTVASVGGSLFTEHYSHALRLDLDARDVFEGPELSFGIVWRF